jgi:hypothetical protein
MIDKILPKYNKQVLMVSAVAYLLPTLSAAFLGPEPLVYLIGGLISLVLFPIGYGMGKLVLGVQARNPYCSEQRLDSFCRAAIYFFGAGAILFGLLTSFLAILSEAALEEMILNGFPGAFGIAFAAYQLRQKHILGASQTGRT